ncbi:unknown [Corallococcus sp. CAG:1435]|nr:unknown [Corallococcus sp. CAG:1435]
MQGRQIRLNGEELKTQNLFFVAFSLEKLKGFVHCTNTFAATTQKIFVFLQLTARETNTFTPFSDNKTSTKTTVCVPKSYYRLKKYVTTLSFATAQTHSKHGQNACRFCVLRHCTRKTFVTISSALQFASAYKTTNKTI